jgi:8-oxo-dGTP pyrophosphatase MutT (NUDIX family)
MNFDPQKFAIGVIDLFSVLLPGAVFIYLTKDTSLALMIRGWTQASTESWIAFAFASYLAGHLIFLLGSEVDDILYDRLRNATYQQQINRLAGTERRLAPRWMRRLAKNWLFGRDPDAALTQAIRIKAATLAPLSAGNAINAFQWSKARLSKENPAGFAMVQRFEADSKFFRSFAVALMVLAAVYVARGDFGAAAFCAVLVVPVLWRYVDQRFAATQQAYWLVITLEASNKDGVRFPAENPRNGPTHAGGVVYRKVEGETRYLVIQARRNKDEWVLPKGHIEPGEDPRAAAVREVQEETGHWARIGRLIGDYQLGTSSDAPIARFYLMSLEEEETKLGSGYRGQRWLTRDAIERMLREGKFYAESMDVIRDAETRPQSFDR